jgi:hypothetical protein
MKYTNPPLWNLIVILGVTICLPQVSRASDNRAHSAPQMSGAYRVIEKTDQGPQIRLRLQLRLINHGPSNLHIQRITLWDRHPEKGATQACAIAIPAGHSADTTPEFTIAFQEYETWQRGSEPRLVLELQSPNGRKATEAVRLSRIAGGKAD